MKSSMKVNAVAMITVLTTFLSNNAFADEAKPLTWVLNCGIAQGLEQKTDSGYYKVIAEKKQAFVQDDGHLSQTIELSVETSKGTMTLHTDAMVLIVPEADIMQASFQVAVALPSGAEVSNLFANSGSSKTFISGDLSSGGLAIKLAEGASNYYKAGCKVSKE